MLTSITQLTIKNKMRNMSTLALYWHSCENECF